MTIRVAENAAAEVRFGVERSPDSDHVRFTVVEDLLDLRARTDSAHGENRDAHSRLRRAETAPVPDRTERRRDPTPEVTGHEHRALESLRRGPLEAFLPRVVAP